MRDVGSGRHSDNSDGGGYLGTGADLIFPGMSSFPPHVAVRKGISGSKNLRSPPQKDFCNMG